MNAEHLLLFGVDLRPLVAVGELLYSAGLNDRGAVVDVGDPARPEVVASLDVDSMGEGGQRHRRSEPEVMKTSWAGAVLGRWFANACN